MSRDTRAFEILTQEEFAREMRPLLEEMAQDWVAGMLRALPGCADLDQARALRDRFHAAVADRDLALVQAMLEEAPGLAGLADAEGFRPIHLLATAEDAALLDLLLSHGATIDERDLADGTALHRADEPGFAAVLLARGAALEARELAGHTPLHLAVSHGTTRAELITFLLAQGADPNCQNLRGETPLEDARAAGNAELQAELRAAGAVK